MPENSCIMQLWAEPSENGSARLNLFTNLISVFNVYTKLETVSKNPLKIFVIDISVTIRASNFLLQIFRKIHLSVTIGLIIRKGEGLVPRLFSALRPLKIFAMDILIIIHIELSITDIFAQINFCWIFWRIAVSDFIYCS